MSYEDELYIRLISHILNTTNKFSNPDFIIFYLKVMIDKMLQNAVW